MQLSLKKIIAGVSLGAALSLPLGTSLGLADDNPEDIPASEVVAEINGVKYRVLRDTSSYEALPSGPYQPWRVVRKLQKLQDDIAKGVPFSQEEYAAYLGEAATQMLKLDDETWNHERNLDAMAIFLMFGGANELGFKALKTTKLGLPQKVFLEASLSFVERDVTRAHALMLLIDHTALPPSMGAQLALAKSMTLSSSRLDLAKKYLHEARRLAPSTLVEEAAIRRLIRIAGESKSFEDLKGLYTSYLLRFQNSFYFSDYVRNVGFAAVRMPERYESDVLEILDEMAKYANPKQTASIAVYVARYAAISGRKKLSKWAEDQIEGKLRPNSKLHTRMEVYAAATKIIQHEKTAETMQQTQTINPDILDAGDVRIFDAVQLIGGRILATQEEMLSEIELKNAAPDKSDREIQAQEKRETMVQNEVANHQVLKKADTLFEEFSQLIPEDTK